MAEYRKNGTLRGVIGNAYIRSLMGRDILQTIPDRSRQNKANNKLAPLMKHTSHHITFLRKEIQVFLGNRHESYMHSKFTGSFIKALNTAYTTDDKTKNIFAVDCADIVGFEFNNATMFKDTFTAPIAVSLTANKQLEVSISPFVPTESVVFPKHCTHALLRLKLFTLQSDFKTTMYKQANELAIPFDKNVPIVEECTAQFNPIELNEKLDVVVVEIQFYYEINSPKQRMLFNSKAYNPSMLIYAK